MSTSISRRRRNLWRKCNRCFWCGQETVLEGASDNLATVDHIRSRYVAVRKQQSENWQKGITVLACWRCNNIREKHETNFLRELDEEAFYEKGNGRPSAFDFNGLHGAIASGLLRCVDEIPEIKRLLKTTGPGRRLCSKLSKLRRYRELEKERNEP